MAQCLIVSLNEYYTNTPDLRVYFSHAKTQGRQTFRAVKGKLSLNPRAPASQYMYTCIYMYIQVNVCCNKELTYPFTEALCRANHLQLYVKQEIYLKTNATRDRLLQISLECKLRWVSLGPCNSILASLQLQGPQFSISEVSRTWHLTFSVQLQCSYMYLLMLRANIL